MEISNIVVLVGSGTDKVILQTDLPNGCYPYDGCATAQIEVAQDTGESYARRHFRTSDIKVIDTRVSSR